MAVATVGAFALAIYTRSGDYTEAIAVMLFYQIGELFQSYAVGKSRKNISALMDIRPDYANIERDGRLEQVDLEEVAVGSVIVVQPGEKIPWTARSSRAAPPLNTSALTGESPPREVQAGEAVISGCINMTGVLKLRTTKEFGESTVSRILDLVENASSRKSRSEDFISKFARFYTPAVCCAALALALLPPLGQMLFLGTAPAWGPGSTVPSPFWSSAAPAPWSSASPELFAGLGGASREGVLIKGSNYLETLAQTRYVVFDKTGTLTRGVFEVNGIHHNQMSREQLLEYAALAESALLPPHQQSLQRACSRELDRSRVTDIQEISGHGVTAQVDGIPVAAGNDKLMRRLGLEPIPATAWAPSSISRWTGPTRATSSSPTR